MAVESWVEIWESWAPRTEERMERVRIERMVCIVVEIRTLIE